MKKDNGVCHCEKGRRGRRGIVKCRPVMLRIRKWLKERDEKDGESKGSRRLKNVNHEELEMKN